jgi:hypothetical protein
MDALNPSVARTPRLTSDIRASRSDRNERIGVPNITGTLRQQALDGGQETLWRVCQTRLERKAMIIYPSFREQQLQQMTRCISEYRAASPAFRPYWRTLARHDIARFRRDYLVPERAAFEAAVRRQQARRAAA